MPSGHKTANGKAVTEKERKRPVPNDPDVPAIDQVEVGEQCDEVGPDGGYGGTGPDQHRPRH